MWVTKLLISPVKKGFFAQKRPNLAQNWHFWTPIYFITFYSYHQFSIGLCLPVCSNLFSPPIVDRVRLSVLRFILTINSTELSAVGANLKNIND